eukprot:TRINITY_DN6428_c0_g1_i1.p1 TRINITY_DN6428_c0_g1~~TRINITY_DN6428_c0_g1_i1.p1  ORF type:complete len:691 (+),score=94.83 TRINITY_DN6428_c0_g1_i1:39-2111(+)
MEDSKKEIVSIIRTLRDDEKIIEIALQACSAVVRGSFLKASTAMWFDKQAGVEKLDESDPKFGDGIDKASGANKPSEILKLRFYPYSFKPYDGILNETGQNELFTSIGSWSYPTGPLWSESSMTELRHNANIVLTNHSEGEPAEIVLPLYLYSASQMGFPFVWAAWNENSGSWVIIRNKELEKAYKNRASDDDTLQLEAGWFPEQIRKTVPTKPVTLRTVEANGDGSSLLGVKIVGVCNVEKRYFSTVTFRLVRYQIADNNPTYNPLMDTVAWLPKPVASSDFQFDPPLDELPPSGVIEYIYSRGSDETINWAPDWECRYALGAITLTFISQLFAVPNQQEYDAGLHQDFKSFMNTLNSDKVDDRFVELIAAASRNDSPDANDEDEEAFLKAMNYFTEMRELVTMLAGQGLDADLIREAILYKLGTNSQPSPMAIAHALEIQYLCWKQKPYLLLLSGTRPCCVANKTIVPLQRLNDTLNDQIFWQLNYTMRMFQWGKTPCLHVNKVNDQPNIKGNFPYESITDQFISATNEVAFVKDGCWMVSENGSETAYKVDDQWFEAATWLMKACSPLMYFIDRAIERSKSTRSEELKSYRGMKNVTLPRTLYAEDHIVLWGAYSSTSGDRGVATSFAGDDTKVAVFSLTGTQVSFSPPPPFFLTRKKETTFLLTITIHNRLNSDINLPLVPLWPRT